MINFPTNPTTGVDYVVNGKVFIWNGVGFSPKSTELSEATLGALIGSSGDATPNDTDYIATSLTAGGLLKKITWTNAKAFLKTYFDTIYSAFYSTLEVTYTTGLTTYEIPRKVATIFLTSAPITANIAFSLAAYSGNALDIRVIRFKYTSGIITWPSGLTLVVGSDTIVTGKIYEVMFKDREFYLIKNIG